MPIPAYGGLNVIEFLQNGEISVKPIIIEQERLIEFQNNIMLFFTGISRTASEVVEEQIKNTIINVPNLNKMKDLVDDAYEILINPNKKLNEFGELLNYTWELKKSLSSKVSNLEIDEMYQKAIAACYRDWETALS